MVKNLKNMSLKEALKKLGNVSVDKQLKMSSLTTQGSSFERRLDLLYITSEYKPVSNGWKRFDKQQIII